MIRFFDSGQDPHQGGFTRTIRPDQANMLTRIDIEGNINQYRFNLVGFGNAMRSNHLDPVDRNKKTEGETSG
ncbi:MAG TPA: hypothetical protein VI776_06220 [Anaerolineales bacterium]|nr:hypothetical protein [Anaerolineales bacterium]